MMAGGARNPNELWQDFLTAAQTQVSSHVLETWLRPVRCVEVDNGKMVLEVATPFSRDWLNDHYLDFIRTGVCEKAGEKIAIQIRVNPELETAHVDEEVAPAPVEPAAPAAPVKVDSMALHTPRPPSETGRFGGRHGHGGDGNSADDRSGPTVSEGLGGSERRKQLNRRYIFDSFVCGPSNQFAFAACKAVAENPGLSYNPLFIFGGVGLGKTHLLSAIGHRILQDRPGAQVIYTSSEQFTNEVINAVLGSKLEEFRNKYRSNCDVILMDDIQLIAGKERTQHEFFHIFNTLYDSQRQIVVTSDKLPHEIPEIEERLRNRFQWGLIADVQPPEIETRIAILRKKALSEGFVLPDEVAFFLAKNIRSNVRELEGALVRIMAHASLTGTSVTVDYARNVLSDILSNRGTQVSVEAIQKIVATYFQVRVADLKSHRRLKALVRPRQVAMYLCRKHTGASFPELGSRFGDKDHTTVMSACSRVDLLLKNDPSLRGQVLELERQLDVVNR